MEFEVGTKVWVIDSKTESGTRKIISGTIKDSWTFSNMFYADYRKEYRVELDGEGFRSFLYSEEDIFESEQDALDILYQRNLRDLTFDNYQLSVVAEKDEAVNSNNEYKSDKKYNNLMNLLEDASDVVRVLGSWKNISGVNVVPKEQIYDCLGEVLIDLANIAADNKTKLSDIAHRSKNKCELLLKIGL